MRAGRRVHLSKLAKEPFNKVIVDPAPLAVHAYLDIVVPQFLHKIVARELTSLVEVKYFRRSIFGDGLAEHFKTEIGCHADRHKVCKHLSRGPVNNRDQIDEAAPHRNIGQIDGPDLIRPFDNEATEQVEIDLVFRVRLADVGFAVDSFDSHLSHQSTRMLCAYRKSEKQRIQSERKYRQNKKKQQKFHAKTLEATGYAVVVTSLDGLDAEAILAIYRYR